MSIGSVSGINKTSQTRPSNRIQKSPGAKPAKGPKSTNGQRESSKISKEARQPEGAGKGAHKGIAELAKNFLEKLPQSGGAPGVQGEGSKPGTFPHGFTPIERPGPQL